MKNLKLRDPGPVSTYRKIAAVAWDAPSDPHVYGSLEIRCEALEAWIAAKRAATGERVTVMHAVTRGLAMVMKRHPTLNSFVRWGGVVQREDIDIFVQIVVEDAEHIGKADLSGVKLTRVDTMDVPGISAAIHARAAKIRGGNDEDFETTKKNLTSIPGWLLGPLLKFISFLQYNLNISPRFIGAPPDPFGSAMVTNVGVFGITRGYAPFFPPARASLILTLGAIEEKAVVDDGKIVVGRVLHLNGTFDHRVCDGYHAGVVAREIRALLENPERLDAA
jgi:pyruvate/2-oxoglutarate dehydrogenase complex dihydrolipoamide acyltransferase (E2) component